MKGLALMQWSQASHVLMLLSEEWEKDEWSGFRRGYEHTRPFLLDVRQPCLLFLTFKFKQETRVSWSDEQTHHRVLGPTSLSLWSSSSSSSSFFFSFSTFSFSSSSSSSPSFSPSSSPSPSSSALAREHASHHNHQYLSKSAAMQMGGAQRYKREGYCYTNEELGQNFPFLRQQISERQREHSDTKWTPTAALFAQVFRERKHININKVAELSRIGGGWAAKFCLCVRVFFFCRSFLLGEKTHKQNSPQNPLTIPRKCCLCVRVFFFCRSFLVVEKST